MGYILLVNPQLGSVSFPYIMLQVNNISYFEELSLN